MKQPSRERLIFIFPILVAALGFFAFVTYWTFQPIHEEFLSTVFDSQAKSFLNGTIEIDPKDISFEAFIHDGKTYTYWGPLAPFMRIGLNFLVPENYGKWARVSCWAAGMMAVWAFALLIWREVKKKTVATSEGRTVFILMVLAMGLGTPVIWLMSSAVVYHEPILWGIAGSLWCLWYGLDIVESTALANRPTGRLSAYLGFSTWLGVTLWSRATFAFPWIGAWVLYLGWWLWTNWKGHSPLKSLAKEKALWALVGPALVAGLFQMELNWVKFGNPLKFHDRHMYYLCLHSNKCTTDYGAFELARFPSSLRAYYGLDVSRYLSINFPYARTNDPPVERRYFDGVESTIPLTLASPWMFMLVPLGLQSLWRKRKGFEQAAEWSLTGLFLFQGLLGLGVWWVVQRYISESLMFLIVLTLLGLRALDLQSSDFKNRVFRGLLVFACVWSIFVSTASAWTWAVESNGVTPREFKVRMKEIMLDADWAVYRITHRQ